MSKRLFFTIGLVITLFLLHGEGLWARLRVSSIDTALSGIPAQKPFVRLDSPLDGWMSSGNGTHPV